MTDTDNPKNEIIQVLPADAYRGFLHKPSTNHQHYVHVARLQTSKDKSTEAYVKLYPLQPGNRSLVNEITGFLFAHALGVSQPTRAFVADIPLRALPRSLPNWLQSARGQRDTYPAFCTERLDGPSAAWQVPESNTPGLIREIASWADLPAAISLDENIANTDRHPNNLIRLGDKRFALIDNGELVGVFVNGEHWNGGHWTAENLHAASLYRNRLSEHIFDHSPPSDTVSAALDRSTQHENALGEIAEELEFWWSTLLSTDDHRAFSDFLNERTGHIEALLRKRYNRLT